MLGFSEKQWSPWNELSPAGANYWYGGIEYTFAGGANTYAFPTTVANALSQSTTSTYAYNTGKPYTVKDPNGATTTYNFDDPLQRLTLVTYPIGSTDTYLYTDNPSDVSVSDTASMTASRAIACDASTVASQTNYDGLGRQISSVIDGITTQTTYDPLFRVYQVSNPYVSGTPVNTTTTYDVLNRVLTVTTPDSAVTQSSYTGSGSYDQTLITDPAGNQRTLYNDALGRLEQVYAAGPSSVGGTSYSTADYTTNYIYDVLDDLTQVASADTAQSSRNRSFAYDGLGRLTSATNPENGTVEYSSYDGNGNLLTKTANGITTTYTYDALNRLKTKSYSDGVTPGVTYSYDGSTSTYSIGRLTQVASAALGSVPATAVIYLQYDPNGRVTSSQQTTNGQSYNFTYTYNDLSLDTETYPSGRAVETCYDSAARVTQVNGTSSAESVPYANLAYTLSAGTVTATNTMGNQLVETDTTNTRLQTTNIQVGSVMTLAFNYGSTNNNGNLLSQTITRGSQSFVQSYAYDSLNRLACANENPSSGVTCAAGTGNWSRTFASDPWANTWVPSNSGVTLNSFTPTAPSNFDSTNHLLTGAYVAGNQTALGGYAFTYDAENRITSSSINSSTTNYVYDGNGHRVMKSTGSVATTYVYDAAGLLVAEYGTPSALDSGTKYVSVDHLGSTRLVTDTTSPTPNQEICYDYLPFGELIPTGTDGRSGCYGSTATPLTQKFTGKERDAETGLDFFDTRYFSGEQGRFTSPDEPFNDQDPSDPHGRKLRMSVPA